MIDANILLTLPSLTMTTSTIEAPVTDTQDALFLEHRHGGGGGGLEEHRHLLSVDERLKTRSHKSISKHVYS